MENVPKITRGCTFELTVTLTQKVVDESGNTTETVFSDFNMESIEINLVTENLFKIPIREDQISYKEDDDGNTVIALRFNYSDLNSGKYGLEVTGCTSDYNEYEFRWYAKPGEAFIIVEASSDSYIQSEKVYAYNVQGDIGLIAVGTVDSDKDDSGKKVSSGGYGRNNIVVHKAIPVQPDKNLIYFFSGQYVYFKVNRPVTLVGSADTMDISVPDSHYIDTMTRQITSQYLSGRPFVVVRVAIFDPVIIPAKDIVNEGGLVDYDRIFKDWNTYAIPCSLTANTTSPDFKIVNGRVVCVAMPRNITYLNSYGNIFIKLHNKEKKCLKKYKEVYPGYNFATNTLGLDYSLIKKQPRLTYIKLKTGAGVYRHYGYSRTKDKRSINFEDIYIDYSTSIKYVNKAFKLKPQKQKIHFFNEYKYEIELKFGYNKLTFSVDDEIRFYLPAVKKRPQEFRNVVIGFSCSTDNVGFDAAYMDEPIQFQEGFSTNADGNWVEINALWNGSFWLITIAKFVS